ncbi:hypothetical protein sos41_01460 [Alphaproteobacteria bacterium SO-S41]|nr:hypothetical protein sos41_01460 [Alphaproteobacteria bacterium SO-S41]
MIRPVSALLAATLGLAACASDILPSTDREKAGPFPTYEIAEIAYKIIEPGVTDSAKLRELGIDPKTTPNLRVINYVEVMRVFMPTDTVTLADLDPAVQGCIGAKTACVGYVMAPEASATQRTGHISLDVLGFQRETEETGWSASMLLLLVDDVVVYKLWSGTPRTEERNKETNPLGPAQDLSGTAKDAIGGAIPKP